MGPKRSFVKPIVEDSLMKTNKRWKLVLLILTSAGEFHHRSHLPLKNASTYVVVTFWSSSIVISGTRKVEKWQSICEKKICKVRKNTWSKSRGEGWIKKELKRWRYILEEIFAVVFVDNKDELFEVSRANIFYQSIMGFGHGIPNARSSSKHLRSGLAV